MFLRKTIDKTLRDVMERVYHPQSGFQWNLLTYLVYESQSDELFPEAIDLSSERLATMAGQLDQYKSKHFKADPLIQQFSKDVFPIETSFDTRYSSFSTPANDGWRTIHTRPHTRRILVKNPTIHSDVIEVLNKVRGGDFSERVHIVSGGKFSLRRLAQNVEEAKVGLSKQNEVYESPIGARILGYMNGLSTNIFSALVKKNIPYARQVAKQTGHANRELDILEFIQFELSQPLYRGVKKSSRIFGVGKSIVSLERSVRKALTVGWYEADLKNAQLAIIAKTWGIKKLQRYLETGVSFWKYLEVTGLEKDLLKTLTYSVCYGAMKKRLYLEAQGAGKTVADVDNFLSLPLVRSIWRARRKQFRVIKENGGAIDYFGKFLSLKDRNKRSVLAQCAQAYELALLEPVFDWFERNKNKNYGCVITLFQHDGFSFTVRPSSFEWVESTLKNLVAKRAKELYFSTTLEIERIVPKIKK